MAKPFKQRTTFWTLDGKKVPPGTPGAKKVSVKSKKWYGFVEKNGKRKAIPLCTDLQKSKGLLNKLLDDVTEEKNGRGDRFKDHRQRPLSDHLDDWKNFMMAGGGTEKHATLSHSRVKRIVEGCKFVFFEDLSASRVQGFLGDLRKQGTGNVSSNHYLTAIKMFCNWMVDDNRMSANPLNHLSKMNEELDRRHDRRNLTQEEMSWLFSTTRKAPTRLGLSGEDRVILYTVAIYTGLRASELGSLTPSSFDLDGNSPEVVVAAAYSKRRREDRVPLHPELVGVLRDWLRGKVPGSLLWGGNWAKLTKASKLFKADLELTRTAWVQEAENPEEREKREKTSFLLYQDSEGRYADFHSLRHTFISNLVRTGATPKVAQELARHSTITLTMDRYAHAELHHITAAVGNLPSLPSEPEKAGQKMKATGTDGRPIYTEFVQTGFPLDHRGSSQFIKGGGMEEEEGGPQILEMSRVTISDHPKSSRFIKEAPPGFEPGMADLQSAALPLGEGANVEVNVIIPTIYVNANSYLDVFFQAGRGKPSKMDWEESTRESLQPFLVGLACRP
jgi:integrase